MDYKYIKQLLERYWNCETSLEESSPPAFFSQEDIPFRSWSPIRLSLPTSLAKARTRLWAMTLTKR